MRACAVLLALCAWSLAANAQDDEGTESELAKDLIGRLDLDVPDSPAFALLGITPQNVINPDTPAELATAILRGDDKDGNGQEGLAVEFRPLLLASSGDMTVGEYRKYGWLSRMALSFAESKGTSDSAPTDRTAIGLTVTPIDEKDPLEWAKLASCREDAVNKANEQRGDVQRAASQAARALKTAQDAGDPAAIAVAQAQYDAARKALDEYLQTGRKEVLDAENKACIEQQEKETANGTQWQLGLGYHDSQVADLDESGLSLWTSYSRFFPKLGGSVIFHARSTRDQIVARTDETNAYDVVDQDVIAVRLRRGSSRQGLLFEASYVDESATNSGVDDSYTTALIGVEFRVRESIWVQIGYGDTFGSNQDKDPALSGQFRWAASKSRFWK